MRHPSVQSNTFAATFKKRNGTNAGDDGNRKFVLVQLPEPTDNPKFPTIADICRERVRRVIARLDEQQVAKNAKAEAE